MALLMLGNWFAQKNITATFVPLQSGGVFYQRANLTGAQYKHSVIFTLDGSHRVLITLDDPITLLVGHLI